jgi:hypothetical protein
MFRNSPFAAGRRYLAACSDAGNHAGNFSSGYHLHCSNLPCGLMRSSAAALTSLKVRRGSRPGQADSRSGHAPIAIDFCDVAKYCGVPRTAVDHRHPSTTYLRRHDSTKAASLPSIVSPSVRGASYLSQ